MTDEIDPSQKPTFTQFSLPPILRNRNAEKDSIEQDPVGDKNKPAPPVDSSRHAERADSSSGEAAQTANGSPTEHLPNKFQAIIYGENGTMAKFTYESMEEVPKWFVNKVVSNYQKYQEAATSRRTENDTSTEPQTIINNRYEIMRDKIEAQGQIGTVGSNSHVHDTSFNQLWAQNKNLQDSDLPELSEELSQLRGVLKKEAKTLENDKSVGEIASAEGAAKAGNGPKILEHLKNAGGWALGLAEKIGAPLATAALKTALGV